jgi:hypothetical protein
VLVKKLLSLALGAPLVFGSSTAFATTLRQPPPVMTIGWLKTICQDRSSGGSGYCEGYLRASIESYLQRTKNKKRNFCFQFLLIKSLGDEIRTQILALKDQSIDGSPVAELWIRAQLVDKCGPIQ